jgi:hypothetical protein
MIRIIVLLLLSSSIYAKCIDLAKFKLRALDGGYQNFQELINKDKINLVSVFQTTCIPCIQEMKFFSTEEFKEKYNVIYINTKESRTELYKFLKKFEFTLDKVLVDSYGKLDKFYKIKNLPMLFFLNHKAKIVQPVTGKETAKLLELEKFNKYAENVKFKKCK